jgi:AraC-like DNA-binding protein
MAALVGIDPKQKSDLWPLCAKNRHSRTAASTRSSDAGALGGKRGIFVLVANAIAEYILIRDKSSQKMPEERILMNLQLFANLSPRNFARLFHSATGQTPARFAERARADAARCKLEQTVLPVETIAEQCGFGNSERMRRTFQRLFDVSPHD